MSERSLTVLIPAYNEEKNLRPTVERVFAALRLSVEVYEVIIVNDGSTDKTLEVAKKIQEDFAHVTVLNNERNKGIGSAYIQGIRQAKTKYFVYVPGDNTWPYRSFFELFGNLGKADIITSYSTNPDVRTFWRGLVSKSYTRLINILYNHHLNYYNGLTIYPLEYLKTEPMTTFGFGFQAETLLKALHLGMSYIELALPIDERTQGQSKAVSLKNIVTVLKTMLITYIVIKFTDKYRYKIPVEKRPQADRTRKQKILIIGASSGIGKSLTDSLAEDGHDLFIAARRISLLDEAAQKYDNVQAIECDVGEKASIKELSKTVSESWVHIDVVINTAGGFGAIGDIETVDEDEWVEAINVNFIGPFLLVKALLPLLKKSGNAKIINFSGGGAFSPFPNYSAYACSKAALARLTECLAVEFGKYGITANAIAPGMIPTEIHEATLDAGEVRAGKKHHDRTKKVMKEKADFEKVVACTRFLVSDAASGLTGKTISSNYDPWGTKTFSEQIKGISESDLYTLRRFNIINLPEGALRKELSKAWASYGTQDL